VYYGTIMHPDLPQGQEVTRHSVLCVTPTKGDTMNSSTVIWGIIGIVLLLVVLRVFGLL
jgi:hypothetical protein